jgi:hypothetical protein
VGRTAGRMHTPCATSKRDEVIIRVNYMNLSVDAIMIVREAQLSDISTLS